MFNAIDTQNKELLSHSLWKGFVIVSDCICKSLTAVIVGIALRSFSLHYALYAKAAGIFIGSLIKHHLSTPLKPFPKQTYIMIAASIAELAVIKLFPRIGIPLAFCSGFLCGLFMKPIFTLQQQSKKSGPCDIVLGNIPD